MLPIFNLKLSKAAVRLIFHKSAFGRALQGRGPDALLHLAQPESAAESRIGLSHGAIPPVAKVRVKCFNQVIETGVPRRNGAEKIPSEPDPDHAGVGSFQGLQVECRPGSP